MRSLREQAEDMAMDRVDMEKLVRVVSEAVTAVAISTNLPADDVLDILENIHVEMVGQLKTVLMRMGDDRVSQGMDAKKMSRAIEKAIASISWATDLDTDEITTIFSTKPGASMEDVVYRLHAQSRLDRAGYA